MRLLSITFIALFGFACTLHGEPVIKRGKLDSVTVYRGQALVTRLIELPNNPGLSEIVVSDLPARVVPGSLFGEAGEGIQVQSVLFRTRASDKDVRAEVQELDKKIQAMERDIASVQSSIAVLQQNAEYMKKLETFTAGTTSAELKSGVLNADTLTKLSGFIFSQRKEQADGTLAAQNKLADLNQQLELLQRSRSEIAGGASTTLREAVLLIDSKVANGVVRLSYLVDSATWAPSYTINATTGKDKVKVYYQAMVSQLSGEDWKDVKMTLSTATPSVVAMAPKLDPLVLALGRPTPEVAVDYLNKAIELKARRAQVQQQLSINGSSNFNNANNLGNVGIQQQAGGTQPQAQFGTNLYRGGEFAAAQRDNNESANRVATEIQMFELQSKDKSAVRTLSRDEETVIVSYNLESRTTLISRADQQLIGIASMEMKHSPYKLAVPVLTPYVYNQSSVTNDSNTVLLSGPSMSYLDGQFVGRGEVPTTAVGAEFTAGFGIDSSLRATREVVDRSEQTQGGNLIITFDYRLSIENFGDKPSSVRLITRMPKNDSNQLKPTLVSTNPALSTDPDFERTQKKQGFLRWDVEVPARAVGTKSLNVEYKLTIEHDKQMSIISSTPGGAPAMSK